MSGAITIKSKAKGERVVKGLIKTQQDAKIDEELGIEGASKKLQRLERKVELLEKEYKKISFYWLACCLKLGSTSNSTTEDRTRTTRK